MYTGGGGDSRFFILPLTICFLMTNTFAYSSIFMGSKSCSGSPAYSISSNLFYGDNLSNSITVYYMRTLVNNTNGSGAVNYLNYKVENGGINVTLSSDFGTLSPIYEGETGFLSVPEYDRPLGSFAKGIVCEIATGKGDSLYWLFTETVFPAGTTSYYNR